MRLREKANAGGDIVTLGWDEAQAALLAGTHTVVNDDDEAETTNSEEDQATRAPA